MIGVLYSRSMLHQLIQGKHSFEKPIFYLEAARQIGEELIFFSLLDINWEEKEVRCWNGEQSALVKRELPSVIINRTRTNSIYSKKMIKRLKDIGSLIINEHNVVSKLEVHRMLSTNNNLRPYLPATKSVTYHSVKKYLNKYTCLFLKPSTASVGKGIIRLRKISNDVVAEFNVLGRTKQKKVSILQIVKMVNNQKRDYLVQQGVPLMSHDGKLVDFRVSVQKSGNGDWQYTGMVGRMAMKGAVVTNLHCGGTPMKAADIFHNWGWDGTEIERKIATLAISIAETLEDNLPYIADIGLDIALDEEQHPWFIEVNFRDLRITFRDAGEESKWRATYANPINYASYLIGQMRGNNIPYREERIEIEDQLKPETV